MALFTANLAGANNTDLTALAEPWAQNLAWLAGQQVDGSSHIKSVSGLGAVLAPFTPTNADYHVYATMDLTGAAADGSNWLSPIWRADAVLSVFYQALYDHGAGEVKLYKWAAGTSPTEIGSYAVNLAGGVHYFRGAGVGTSQKVWIDGVRRINITDATISAKGKPGIANLDTVSVKIGPYYAADAASVTLACTPTDATQTGAKTLTFTGAGTRWTVEPPAFTAAATAGTATISAINVTGDGTATATLTTTAATGICTITDHSTDATTTVSLTNKQLILAGMSIPSGYGLSSPNRPQDVLAAILGSDWLITAVAVGASDLDDMLDNFSTQCTANFDSTKDQVVGVCWEIINFIFFGGTGAEAIAKAALWCSRFHSLGSKAPTVIVGPSPRSEVGTPAGQETERQAGIAILDANWRQLCDAVAFIHHDVRIGDSGDEANATYYADLVHPTAAGAAIMSQYVAGAVMEAVSQTKEGMLRRLRNLRTA